jgi:hypothetical protein
MMELTTEEQERIHAIQRVLEGDHPVFIYQDLHRSKKWFNKWLNRYHTGNVYWYKDLSKRPHNIRKKTDTRIETAVVRIRTSLMDGSDESTRYSFVGAEAIQFQMEKLGYEPSDVPSQSTIKRVIKRNKLRVNKKERYKRVKSKGRHTIFHPDCIDEMHVLDIVGQRHIKGFGSINSIHLKDVIGRHVAGYQYVEKSMDNVMGFLLNYWRSNPIPRYLQVDNGMSFAGDYIHLRSFSRFVRLCLYVGIGVIFIAPAKPWMNGTIEEFNKSFDRLFWQKETFTDLSDIRQKAAEFFSRQNKFYEWQMRKGKKSLESITPKHMLRTDFDINLENVPLVAGKIHFIRQVDGTGMVSVLNERFSIGGAYIGDYITAIIDTKEQSLEVLYRDEEMVVRSIKKFEYKIDETVYDLDDHIFCTVIPER